MRRSSVFVFSVGFLVLLLFGYSAHAQTWKDLIGQADSLSTAENLDSAVLIAKVALQKVEVQFGRSDTTVASMLNTLGKLYYRQAKYAEAEPLFKRALEIREKTLGPHHPDVAISLSNLGNLYEEQARYAEAELLYKQALEIREKALGPDHLDVGASLNSLGILYWAQGRYEESELFWKRALEIREKALGPNHPSVAMSLNNLGVLYWTQGKYADVEPLWKRALEIWEKILGTDHPDVAGILDNLGILYHEQGRYAKAELFCERALEIREKALGTDHPDVAISLYNLGNPYYEQGRYADVEPLWKRALEIREKILGTDHPDVGESLNSLGVLYHEQGRYTEAEPLYRQALEIQEKALGPDHRDVAMTLNNLGGLCSEQGRYVEAESLYRQALKIQEKALGADHRDVAMTLNSLGILYNEQGRYAEAELFCERALEIREIGLGPDHPDVASCLSALAILYRNQGKWCDARGLGRRAYDIRRKNFRGGFEVLSEKNALLYSQFMRDEAGNYLSILCDSPDTSSSCSREIADVVFSSKGQVSDGIFARQRAFSQEPDSSLRSLAESLRLARFKLAKLYVRGPDEEHPESYRDELAKLSAEKEQLESELARRSASFRRELEIWQVDYMKVSQYLPTGSALVEYMKYNYIRPRGEAEPRYLVVVINSYNEVFTLDLGGSAKIDSSVSWYRSHFQFPSLIDEKDYKRISEEIYSLTWKPIQRKLGQAKIVFIAPDGALNLVSFAGLMDATGKYLIEKYPIHYLSSARDLLRLRERAPARTGLLALGDPDYDAPPSARLSAGPVWAADTLLVSASPIVRNIRSGCKELRGIKVSRLPQTRHEVELISKRWKKERKESEKVYLGVQASEETFKANALGSRVIHLATHGYFVSPEYTKGPQQKGFGPSETFVGENPLLFSGLFLAGSNLHGEGADSLGCEDGILTAEEVAGMDLEGTELVVLSACETGLGEVKLGEGVYGLRRAFQMAGVRTVISALWPVSDETTAELMGKLYGIKRGNIPQLMQKMAVDQIGKLRKKGQSDHPYSWGAFIALGDWRIEQRRRCCWLKGKLLTGMGS